jgi:hypothetical protein
MTSRFRPLSSRVGAESSASREVSQEGAPARLAPPVRTQVSRLGRHRGTLCGIAGRESRALLAKLAAHATRREIVYRTTSWGRSNRQIVVYL